MYHRYDKGSISDRLRDIGILFLKITAMGLVLWLPKYLSIYSFAYFSIYIFSTIHWYSEITSCTPG